jgi:hypothetical protein
MVVDNWSKTEATSLLSRSLLTVKDGGFLVVAT